MKNIIFLICLVLCLSGCDQESPEEEKPVSESKNVIESVEEFIQNEYNEIDIFDKIELITQKDEVQITWDLTASEYFDFDGNVINSPRQKDEVLIYYELEYLDEYKQGSINALVYPSSFENISLRFEKQFSLPISKNYQSLVTEFLGCYNVSWHSSNQNIFSDDGIFTKPFDEDKITITYTITAGNTTKEYSFDSFVYPYTEEERIEQTLLWIRSEEGILHETVIDKEIILPQSYEKMQTTITWSSSNENVINNKGVVKQSIFARYVSLKATITYGSLVEELLIDVEVAPIDSASLTTLEKLDLYLEALCYEQYSGVTYGYYYDNEQYQGKPWNINMSFGFLPFFNNEQLKIVEEICPINNYNRAGTKLKSVEFIVVHDTADSGTAANHAKAVANQISAVSYQYCVDTKEAYHIIPDDEYAYHAGCGSRAFKLNDTGIKATNTYPMITIDSEGRYLLNGKESLLFAPTATGGKILTTKDIVDSGIYTEIGENGNYYMNSTYYNTDYKKISNHGGGINGIGIETCVVPNQDYILTTLNNAKLVVGLLNTHNLGINRVTQHNNFSGKDCPIAIRHAKWWNNFLDLLSLTQYGMNNFSQYTFEWVPLTDNISSLGIISSSVNKNDVLKYKCIVKANNIIVQEKEGATKIV